jgi:pimeloyl-ACP methyl ester carboxylesterase
MPARPLCVLLPGFDGSGRLFEPLLAKGRLPFEPRVVALPTDVPRGYDELADWLVPQLPARARAALAADEAASYARITAPTLWIQARRDRLLRFGHADEARAARPGVRIESIPGPHTILQRRPGEAVALIERFLVESAGRS